MSSFGTAFRVTTFGESHGKGVGAIVEGVPPGLLINQPDIQLQLNRRRPGQSDLATPRNERDVVSILSGVERGIALGTPIGLFVANDDQRPGDYQEMAAIPRPSHADFTYQLKYNVRASSGGGRASARETIGRVAAGAIAEKWLRERFGVAIVAWVSAVGPIEAPPVDMARIRRAEVDRSVLRCPDAEATRLMIREVNAAKNDNDSVGGVVTCVCRGLPAGWGEPCFDKLEALLGHAMLSIPATKGFEFGSGFSGARMRGSLHNDPFVRRADGTLGTQTNNSGISNGEPVYFRVAFKPPATIGKDQRTSNFRGDPVVLAAKGRHDPCVVPRAVPIVEAMAALCLADVALLQLGRAASQIPNSAAASPRANL